MKTTLKQNFRKGERGNVLFLILIAVALFAALSYAVTSSTRGGGGNANEETNLVQSSAITQYPSSVRTAIIRMVVNGVDSSELLFDGPANFGAAAGNVTAALAPRAVFHPSGGGSPKGTAPADVMAGTTQGTWIFSSDYQITNIGTNGAAGNDVIAFLPGVSASVCRKINEELGITIAGTDADGDGVSAVAATDIPAAADEMTIANPGFGGALTATKVIGGDFATQPFGCYDGNDAAATGNGVGLVYYHVLLER